MKDEKLISSVSAYLDKVIRQCYTKEGRAYDPQSICIRYVIIKIPDGRYVMHPLYLWCKYDRVHWEITRRLKKFMLSSVGVHYGWIEEEGSWFKFSNYKGQIDLNFSEASFLVGTKNAYRSVQINLSIFDCVYDDIPEGECMGSKKYEQLLFKYHGLTAEDYRKIMEDDKDDPRLHIPDNFRHNWEDYYKLHIETFGVAPGEKYEFICGPGVKRVEVKLDEKS